MENTEKDVVLTQDGDIASIPSSMQVYQAIYNEITGKTEEITDSYKNYLVIELKDLLQLKHLFEQFLEQYHVDVFNTSITIFHIKSSKERFSSFERLNTYNSNNNSPIERVNIELNFLIVPPKLSKPQNYKVSINMVSGAAVATKNKLDIPDDLPMMVIMRTVQEKAIEIKIEYIDYIIARSISELLREWVGSIQELKPDNNVKKLQKKARHFSRATWLIFYIISIVVSVTYASAFFSSKVLEPALLVKFLLISGSFILLSKEVGVFFGRNIEHKMHSINTNEVTFIHINIGDKKLYKKFQEDISLGKSAAWKSGFIALGIGIFSSIMATIIYNTYLVS